MIKSILVAIDESISSKSALNVGVELSKLLGAKIKGLYIENIARLLEQQPSIMSTSPGSSRDAQHLLSTTKEKEVEQEFLEEGLCLNAIFEETCRKVDVKGSFSRNRGKVDDLLIEASRAVDLVVVGRRGKTFPENSKKPGPTTESLLRHTARPVLVVPAEAQTTARIRESKLAEQIIIAYDGSNNAQRALAIGTMFAKFRNSKVEVVSVSDDPKISGKSINESIEFISPYELDVTYKTMTGANKPWKAIMQRVKNFEAGLIVIGAFGENRLVELIFGSTTREILMHANCPVLLCR